MDFLSQKHIFAWLCRKFINLITCNKLREIKRLIPLPRFKKLVHKYDGKHYWEIGKAGYPLSKIINDIQRAGFKIERTYRVFEHPTIGSLY